MKNPDISLIDINGLGYASMYIGAFSKMQVNGFSTGGLYGALTSLLSNMKRNPNTLPVVLWDRRATWRHLEFPGYKGNRSDTPEKVEIRKTYRSQVPIIQLMINALGIPQVSCGESEADDLAGVICRNIDPSWQIQLTSKDTDWYQSIADNVIWYSPMSKISVDLAVLADPNNGLSDGHFFSPREYLMAKALAGDTSDCIPGIEKVGLATAVKIMRAHGGTIDAFWAEVDAGTYEPKGVVEKRVALDESRETYKRNLRLMDWSLAPPINTSLLSVTAGKPDWAQATAIAEEFGLKKVIATSMEVLQPWKDKEWGDALWAVDAALNHEICIAPVNKLSDGDVELNKEYEQQRMC